MRTQKHKKLVLKLVSFLTAGIVTLAGIIYFLFFAGIFDVKSVNMDVPEGLRANLNAEVENWLNGGFWVINRRSNIFLASATELAAQLKRQFPKLELVSISKDFPHGLILSATERKPVGIWCQTVRDTCFYFDKNGIAFSETQPSSGFLITKVTDKKQREIKFGSEVISSDWFERIISVRGLLDKIDVSVSEFVIPADSFDEFHAKTAEGWKIMFSIQTDTEKQISALAIFLKEKIKPDQRSALQYIDLRIQGRIYYK